ncbi:MAG: 14.7 kDa ribonuclease H-like protein [candidate division WS2 bacterium ADurb.Bin280]|uniref:14.7 kDa ribonuclease H-like protein n=1 Tax=candidate division WS2 bacterium ADurb.Bin280 TaxID=1852829 RepID=A0A1V5SDS5_9BACT|nr:MAG: 14.7 kDa ribonuclease H-like protein [candidate division WS2 bacterium ADurb.Bin280]
MRFKILEVFTDGGARGNPGPAAIGVFVMGDSKELEKKAMCIGEATNNVAEYSAFLESIKLIKDFECGKIVFKLDSELVVRQINGQYKVKNEKIRPLFAQVVENLSMINVPYEVVHIRREENKVADSLVNQALDQGLNS